MPGIAPALRIRRVVAPLAARSRRRLNRVGPPPQTIFDSLGVDPAAGPR